jgi:hypothetical protein
MKKNKSFTKADVLALLKNPRLVALEKKVAKAVSSRVVDPAPEITVPENWSELKLTDMTREGLEQLLESCPPLVPKFSIALFKGEGAVSREEEHNPAEGNQQDDDDYEESDEGLCHGFLLTHLCYLSFLLNGRDSELVAFLKACRVPKAERYAKRLKKYHLDTRGY